MFEPLLRRRPWEAVSPNPIWLGTVFAPFRRTRLSITVHAT